MVLAVNIGNTHICVGGYCDNDALFSAKLSTAQPCTADEYAIKLTSLLQLYGHEPAEITGAILASVVPALTGRMLHGMKKLSPVRVLTVGPGLKSGVSLRIDDPAQLGAELLCAAVGCLQLAAPPLLMTHVDTAITMMGINAAGQLVGGVILPAPETGLHGLVSSAGLLPQVDLSAQGKIDILGGNTAACLRSGSILGTAAMLDGLVGHFKAQLGAETRLFITGSLPPAVLEHCESQFEVEPNLILNGMYAIWRKNQKQ